MLELEVTEQVFLGDIEHTIQRLNVFRDLGISIALDDFGTGYSSLQYLKLLPIDTLKIDRSFVADLQLGEKPLSILKAILTMAKDLNLKVVVEGVETEAQLEQLKSMDCEVAQGFYFHRPMPLSDLNILLDSQFSQQSTSELLQGISHPA